MGWFTSERAALVAGDTRRLYKVDMNKAFQDGDAKNAVLGARKACEVSLKGSFVDFDGTSIFVGSSEKDASKAKGFFLPVSVFEELQREDHQRRCGLKKLPDSSRSAMARPSIDGGNLWMTLSSSKHGDLQKVDPASGKVLAQYDMVIGIEDLGFDEDGRLWSVSEAGSLALVEMV